MYRKSVKTNWPQCEKKEKHQGLKQPIIPNLNEINDRSHSWIIFFLPFNLITKKNYYTHFEHVWFSAVRLFSFQRRLNRIKRKIFHYSNLCPKRRYDRYQDYIYVDFCTFSSFSSSFIWCSSKFLWPIYDERRKCSILFSSNRISSTV